MVDKYAWISDRVQVYYRERLSPQYFQADDEPPVADEPASEYALEDVAGELPALDDEGKQGLVLPTFPTVGVSAAGGGGSSCSTAEASAIELKAEMD